MERFFSTPLSPSIKKYTMRKKELLNAYFLVSGLVILLGLIIFYPTVEVLIMSFSHLDPMGNVQAFAGFANFRHLLIDNPLFFLTLYQTFLWTVSMVIITTIISLVAAELLNRSFQGRTLMRLAVVLPWTISPAILAFIWRYIYDGHYGLLNLVLKNLGIIKENISWLAYPNTALPAAIWVGINNSVPFTTLCLLGGLQGISSEVYEAAEIDGASGWSRFFYITLPLLKPVFVVVTLFNVILIFRSFPIIWVLTRGGPGHFTEIIGTYIYKTAFKALDAQVASATAIVAMFILLTFTIFFIKLSLKEKL